MTIALQTDADLIRCARAGDDKAFRELVNRYAKLVYNHIYRMSQNLELADELTQEVFVNVYQKLDTFDTSRAFKPWLLRIAINRTVSNFRKQARLTSLNALEESGHWRESADSSCTPDISEEIDSRLSSDHLLKAMGQLDPKYRQILLLRYKEELLYEEIAEVMGIPLNTVRTWLKRGREALLKKLGT